MAALISLPEATVCNQKPQRQNEERKANRGRLQFTMLQVVGQWLGVVQYRHRACAPGQIEVPAVSRIDRSVPTKEPKSRYPKPIPQ